MRNSSADGIATLPAKRAEDEHLPDGLRTGVPRERGSVYSGSCPSALATTTAPVMTNLPETAPRGSEVYALVSIIIPCWNAEEYVGQAISSALAQTYPNVEVIVVDDGSTDDSLTAIRGFGDRIRWTTGPNRGGCAARNTGLEMARGDLVQFLDADDLLLPEKVARQVMVVSEDPEAITYCDHFVQTKGATSFRRRDPQLSDETDPVVLVLRHRTLSISGPLHPVEQLRAIGGFRIGLPASQEFDLHLRLAVAGRRFRYVPEPLFTVRRRPNSVSSHFGRTMACLLSILPEAVERMKDSGQLDGRRRVELAAYAARAARVCLREGCSREGVQLLELAEALDSPSAEQAAYGSYSRRLKRLVGPRAVELTSIARHRVGRAWSKLRVRTARGE